MKYIIVNKESAVCEIAFTNPSDTINIEFENAGEASVVAKVDGREFYRTIENGSVSLPVPKKSSTMELFYVEGDKLIELTPLDFIVTEAGVIVRTNPKLLVAEVDRRKREAEKINEQILELRRLLDEQKDRFEELFEGYNII